jgi:hypothetical protein
VDQACKKRGIVNISRVPTIPPPSCPRMTGKRPCNIISGAYLGFRPGTDFRIFATSSVLVGMADTYKCISISNNPICCKLTGVQYMDSNFVGFWGCNLNLFDLKGLSCTPANSGLTLDCCSSCGRHLKRFLLKLVVVKIKEDGNLNNYLYKFLKVSDLEISAVRQFGE